MLDQIINDKIMDVGNSTDKLKQLILDNPELPIVILSSYESCTDEYYWTYCTSINCGIEEYMSYDVFGTSCVITDRGDFEEKLRDELACDSIYDELTDAEFDKVIEAKLREYEPYWKKAIFVYADN